MTKWQDISTAPKDGTHIWAILDFQDSGGKEQHAVWWDDAETIYPWRILWGSMTLHSGVAEHVVTHWMPLPTPPIILECEACGQSYQAVRTTSRYCSSRCRWRIQKRAQRKQNA